MTANNNGSYTATANVALREEAIPPYIVNVCHLSSFTGVTDRHPGGALPLVQLGPCCRATNIDTLLGRWT